MQNLLTKTIYPGIDNGTIFPSYRLVDKTLRKLEECRDSEFALAAPATYTMTAGTTLTISKDNGLLNYVTQQSGIIPYSTTYNFPNYPTTPDELLTVALGNNPDQTVQLASAKGGTVTLTTNTPIYYGLINESSGDVCHHRWFFTYTPPSNGWSGTDSFSYHAVYTACESNITYQTFSDPVTVTIVVNPATTGSVTYSGHVWLKTNVTSAPTVPAPGIKVAASDGSVTATTDSNGNYSLSMPAGWAGYLTLPNLAMRLSTGAFTAGSATCTQDFTLVPYWNAATDYSNTQNPAGAWSYGWQSNTVPFQPFPTVNTQSETNGVDYLVWCGYGMQLGRKTTDTALLANIMPGDLTMMTLGNASNGESVVARWAAPIDGTFVVFGRFGRARPARKCQHRLDGQSSESAL